MTLTACRSTALLPCNIDSDMCCAEDYATLQCKASVMQVFVMEIMYNKGTERGMQQYCTLVFVPQQNQLVLPCLTSPAENRNPVSLPALLLVLSLVAGRQMLV